MSCSLNTVVPFQTDQDHIYTPIDCNTDGDARNNKEAKPGIVCCIKNIPFNVGEVFFQDHEVYSFQLILYLEDDAGMKRSHKKAATLSNKTSTQIINATMLVYLPITCQPICDS